jgi:hypothetical protein
MDDNQAQQPAAQSRRFIYRSIQPEGASNHPARRSTDTPRPFFGVAGELCPGLMLVQMRVYLKVN